MKKFIIALLALALRGCQECPAHADEALTMKTNAITAIHLAALSQVESGDDDAAIGRAGEITRFQIMPAVFGNMAFHPTGALRHGWALDVTLAREVAREIWSQRVATFRTVYRREPSLTELYLCWHRPARVLNPKRREQELAVRFANLVKKLTSETLKN